MSKTYDIPIMDGAPFTFDGWHDGEVDCYPPEPGKYWLTIRDCDDEEVAIIVHRGDIESTSARRKEAQAEAIVARLNGDY